jgi:hypothetical protein
MRRLLGTVVPICLLATLVAVPASSGAPNATSPWNGGFAGNAPHTPNYEWVSSTPGAPNQDAGSTGTAISDSAFTGNYYIQGQYDVTSIWDITNPASPSLVSTLRCQGSQNDVIVQGNLLFVAKENSHNAPSGDLNRSCETAGANQVQRISMTGFNADGESYTIRFGGNDTVPIVRGQNNTTAGVIAALQGGNELNTVSLQNYDADGDSYTLNLNGANTVPITRGQNNTVAGVTAALQGGSEQQQISLTGFGAGASYSLQLGGQISAPFVHGSNHDSAGIQNALLGVDEIQAVSIGGAFDPTATDQLTVSIGGNSSAPVPAVPGPLTAGELATAINGITGFAGTASVSNVTNNGFTVTFGGASRKLDVSNVGVGFPACATTCTASVDETRKGRSPLHPSLLDATISTGTVTDTGYTLTFGGTAANTDVLPLSVVNGNPAVTGTMRELVKGSAPVAGWAPGGTVTVGSFNADTGYTLAFAGGWANTDVPGSVTVANGTGSPAVAGTTRENVRGGPGVTGWPVGGTVTVANSAGGNTPAGSHNDYGYTMTFTGTLAGTNPAMISVTNQNGIDRVIVERTVWAGPSTAFQGLGIWDISDKANPKFVKGVPTCGGAHTFTKYFDKKKNRTIIYMTRGTTTGNFTQYGLNCTGITTGRLTAIVVPMKNPKAAYVGSENILTGFGTGGCHDVNVHQEAKLLAMACPAGGASLSDITDPLNPTLKWTFTWPGLVTTHSAAISWDAKFIYVNGEPGGGTGFECAWDDDIVKPTLHVLSAATGEVVAQWSQPRPQQNTIENCSGPHVIQMIPYVGRHILASSFYTGGMSLIDLTNPKAAREIGFMDLPTPPPGTTVATGASNGIWSAYVYNDHQYGSEITWGWHVWRLDEPWWDDQMQLTELNGQTADAYIRCKITSTGGPARALQLTNAGATVQLFGPAALQPGEGVKVRFEAPGFNKEVLTDSSGQASIPVISNAAGKLRISAPVQANLPFGCSAKPKTIKKAAR